LPTVALARLATDADPRVRTALAHHPLIEEGILRVLAHDDDPKVCEAVAARADCPRDLFDELVATAPEAVLANPEAPAPLLAAGSQVRAVRVRAAVAGNPSTPSAQLDGLSRDEHDAVLRAVAENASASPRARRRAKRKLGRSPAGGVVSVDEPLAD
jgi:hypothetical protein